ncbi:MAG: TldD/PmbA family protein, partial [Candidatus Hodarchaeales archaeon]
IKNSQIDIAEMLKERGMNIRVILNGAWGMASSSRVSKKNIDQMVEQAINVSKSSAKKLRKPVELTEEPVVIDSFQTPFNIDPFEVDISDKIELLKTTDSILKEAGKEIRATKSFFEAYRINLILANSEGSKINQTQTYVGSGVSATAVGTEVQLRSSRDYKMKGFEHIREFDYETEATRVANEALILINEAKNCPNEKIAFILEPDQLGLTVHESTGHPSELDRVLGYEADFAGTSFLTPDKLHGNYRYGSDIVNLVCDPTLPYALGSYKYDDEGVEAKKFPIVENGIFKNYMTDRETAKNFGYEHSFGNARLGNYNRLPIIRMGNLHLLSDPKGPRNLEEMITETKHGIFGQTWKSHSIDDKRMNFQFSTELGWSIEKGEKTQPLKNLCYNAATPEFWGACDMITQATKSYGRGPVCGKGIPMQSMWVEHGGGWARFQNVNVFAG